MDMHIVLLYYSCIILYHIILYHIYIKALSVDPLTTLALKRHLVRHVAAALRDVGHRRRGLAQDAGAALVVLVVLGLQVRVPQRLREGDVGVLRVAAHEAQGLPRDQLLRAGKEWW